MSAVNLIYCPYDAGRRDWRCGYGPTKILEQGAVNRIEATGAEVRLVEIEPKVFYESENTMGFEVQRRITEVAASARKANRLLPLVIAGNCNAFRIRERVLSPVTMGEDTMYINTGNEVFAIRYD